MHQKAPLQEPRGAAAHVDPRDRTGAGEALQDCPLALDAMQQELPKALQKASLLFSALAHEN